MTVNSNTISSDYNRCIRDAVKGDAGVKAPDVGVPGGLGNNQEGKVKVGNDLDS